MKTNYSIIYSYIIKEFLISFVVAFLFFFFIFFINQLLLMAEEIFSKKVPFGDVVLFIFFSLPAIVAIAFPFASLVGSLMCIGRLSADNEIMALKSSGVSVFYLLKPVIVIGLIFSMLLFFFSEAIVPITMGKANQIWLREVRKELAVISKEKNIWIKGNRSITHIAYFNPKIITVYGITLYQFDEKFRLIR
ncbi:hypothetical protein LCGC14_3083840, partial [marine sediment metagenome]